MSICRAISIMPKRVMASMASASGSGTGVAGPGGAGSGAAIGGGPGSDSSLNGADKSLDTLSNSRRDDFLGDTPHLTPPTPPPPRDTLEDSLLFKSPTPKTIGHWPIFGYNFTILTLSLVVCLWFWIYRLDRGGSSSTTASGQTNDPTNKESSSKNNQRQTNHQYQSKSIVNDLEIRLYNTLPLRATSSLWGKINSYDLPIWMRSGLYDFFCRTYNCDMSEALESDFKSYRNLSEFFSRRLKPDSRPISDEPGVVSPADGLVLHFGPIQVGRIEGVKGLNYSLQAFLGLPSSDYEKELIVDKKNNELYNCIIYLAPGDYHRFHSPAQWLVKSRKHFPGRLLSVRPSLMKRMPEVLHINERVCYTGSWAHGFFSMTAVGATNVGSIKVNFDEDLRTNRRHLWRPDRYACFEHNFAKSVELESGQDFGEFNFGSTIVLIFEAPKNSTFEVKANQKIKYGQLMARIEPPSPSPPTSVDRSNQRGDKVKEEQQQQQQQTELNQDRGGINEIETEERKELESK